MFACEFGVPGGAECLGLSWASTQTGGPALHDHFAPCGTILQASLRITRDPDIIT